MTVSVPDLRRAAAAADALHERRASLKPQRRLLGLDGAGDAAAPVSTGIEVGGQTVALEAWERVALEAERRGGPSTRPGDPLIVEGLAFRVKHAARFDRLACLSPKVGGPERFGTLLEELIADAAVGLAVSHDFQESINQLVVAGEMSDAKRLTSSRNKVGAIITVLKGYIGEEAYDTAEQRSKEMIAPVREISTVASPELGRVIEAGWRKKTPARVHVMERAEDSLQTRTKPLALLLLCCLALWSVLILPRFTRSELPVLVADDFGPILSVLEINSRPPSLFVKVSKRKWAEMTPEGRLDVLKQLGSVASEAGYTGAHVTTRDGVTVGQWLNKTGAHVVERVNPAPR